MRLRQRPISQHGAPPPQTRAHATATTRPARKIFNCIVDDSALVAGVKKSTRNGIRQWVKNGQIRLFVPLHALEELSRQKSGKSKHAEDVRDTLQWLDDATTKFPDSVALQGADEVYEKWVEVEKFIVPRTLFSEDNHEHELELVDSTELPFEAAAKLNITDDTAKDSFSSGATDASRSLSPSSRHSMLSSASQISPPTSPHNVPDSPALRPSSINATPYRPDSSSTSVPMPLQPLFNYILWRIHQELDPVAALESFIFLCNDPRKVHFAKGFDIKTKRLEQLREAVGREDRDFKNRMALLSREGNPVPSTPRPGSATDRKEYNDTDENDDDEVVFEPPRAPAAMREQTAIDPHAFERSPLPASLRVRHAVPFVPRGSTRGGRGGIRASPRGRGIGRGGSGHEIQQKENLIRDSNGQIDPASFARPDTRNNRKLWVPT